MFFGLRPVWPDVSQRTGMNAATRHCGRSFVRPQYAKLYEKQPGKLKGCRRRDLLKTRPAAAPIHGSGSIRAHPTHKSDLACVRVDDHCQPTRTFKGEVEQSFPRSLPDAQHHLANYQNHRSLDVGRRQVELEGFRIRAAPGRAAMSMRRRIRPMPILQNIFKVLTAGI